MWLYLVHHGDAIPPEVDPRRPLSHSGHAATEALAEQVATIGARPLAIWHSGKLRARQTAELFWRACNPFAECLAVPGLQPADFPGIFRDRVLGEPRDVMAVGHMPNLPRVLAFLTAGADDEHVRFPLNGVVALEREVDDGPWIERWRLDVSARPAIKT